MEEELELFSDKGLEGFGKLLGAALKRPIVASADQSSEDVAAYFPLQLTYRCDIDLCMWLGDSIIDSVLMEMSISSQA